jgi:hypothetical protein
MKYKNYSPEFETPAGGEGETIDNSSDKNLVKDQVDTSEFDFDKSLSELITEDADEPVKQTAEQAAKDFQPPQSETETTQTDESVYKILVDQLKTEGLFEDSDLKDEEDNFEFDGTSDSFKELMERREFKRSIKIFEDIVDQMPSKMKKQFQLFMDGVDPDSALDIGSQIVDYSSITKTTLENDPNKAEQLYRDLLKTKGFSDEKINKYVERAKDLDEIVDEGFEAAQLLSKDAEAKIELKKQEEKQAELKRAEAAQNRLKALKNLITQTPEIFKGVPLNDKIKEKLYESMTKPVEYDENKRPLNRVDAMFKKNPDQARLQLHYLAELGLFNTDEKGNAKPDLKKILQLAETKVAKNIDERLKKAVFKTGSNLSNNISEDETDVVKNLEAFLGKS